MTTSSATQRAIKSTASPTASWDHSESIAVTKSIARPRKTDSPPIRAALILAAGFGRDGPGVATLTLSPPWGLSHASHRVGRCVTRPRRAARL